MDKKNKIKNSTIQRKILPLLIFLSTIFMSIGYATTNSISLNINGEVVAKVQDGVFITNVEEPTNTQLSNGKINYYRGTTLNTEITLTNDVDATFTYEITLYNNSAKDYMFIGDIINLDDPNSYTNTNISYTIDGITEYKTAIKSKEMIKFTITFCYTGENTTNANLKSIINFRFREMTTIELSNENQILTLNKIYPNYTPKEYDFTVSNYNDEAINAVPMKYSFEIEIDKPLTAKIYDSSGNEVTQDTELIGNNIDKISNEYTLKIFWDNTNMEENIAYNDLIYANEEFNCIVNLKATPSDSEYLNNTLIKTFAVDIKSSPYNLSTSIEKNMIELNINTAETVLNLMNYISDNQYNEYDVEYQISLSNNDKFQLTTTDSQNGVLLSGINKNDITVILNSVEDVELDYTEEVIIKIAIISPYKDEKKISVNIINSEKLIGQNLEYNVAYTDMYTSYEFTSADGWRILDPGTLNTDGTYSNTKIVTTGIPVKLYYNLGQDPKNTNYQSSKWWGTTEEVNKEYDLNLSNWNSGYSRYFAAYGMKYNFTSIPFSSGANTTKNKGYYTKITNSSATSTTTGAIFINENAKSVHALLVEEMNTAINKILRNNNRTPRSLATISTTVDPRAMFYLRGLNNYNYSSSSSPQYWLGSPNSSATGLIRVQAAGTFAGGTDNTYGVRPVITLNKNIQLNNEVWEMQE